jgi:hypothetical protein
MPEPSAPSQRWTIYVCPDCGQVEGQGFSFEPGDPVDAWLCEGCDNYPCGVREVEVLPASYAQELEDALRRLVETVPTLANPSPDPTVSLLALKNAREILSRLHPDKEDRDGEGSE